MQKIKQILTRELSEFQPHPNILAESDKHFCSVSGVLITKKSSRI